MFLISFSCNWYVRFVPLIFGHPFFVQPTSILALENVYAYDGYSLYVLTWKQEMAATISSKLHYFSTNYAEYSEGIRVKEQ